MKNSITEILASLNYLAKRTAEMAISGGSEDAFAEVAKYRDGAIYCGYYSGNSEWERHPQGDEIVMCLDGSTTLVLFSKSEEVRETLSANELYVVPANTWHKFEDSNKLKVMTVTPQPTDHRLDRPDA